MNLDLPVAQAPDEDTRTGSDNRIGPAIASVALSSVGVIIAVSTWMTWLDVLPGDNLTLGSQLAEVFRLVLGALWFAVLPVGVLGVLFGTITRTRPAAAALAKIGIVIGLLALAIALAGVIAFLFVPSGVTPLPVAAYHPYFN